MQFDGSSPLLVGGISTPIMGEEHFIAAIDDRNAFSSVTMVPNGSGEAFGAGGVLIFSTLQLNSVPEGSSVVTIGDATDITGDVEYSPTEVNEDRRSVVKGKRGSVRVDLGDSRLNKKKKKK